MITPRFALFTLAAALLVQAPGAIAQHRPASAIPAASLIEPAALAARLAGPAPRPLVLQVGSHVLYTQAHIPASEYAGPGGEDEGLARLRKRVAPLAKDSPVVLYCGCCPWARCPNIAAAYDALRSLGFTHVSVLHIAENFGADWADKGYPVASGG